MAGSFFDDDAKNKIVQAVRDVESRTSAEIVVSARGRCDDYRELDLSAGLLLAVLTLTVLMYHPAELDEELMPVEVVGAFVLGSVLVNKIGALKRFLMSKKRRDKSTLTAARAHFVEMGISRTRDRSGILVFVSELERSVTIVADIGIETDKLGDAWKAKVAEFDAAGARLDIDAFLAALTSLGPLLGATYPRKDDDVNELPDAPLMEAR